jgi:hypothetical protein
MEWVANQHRTGAAASNPNFIQISDAWRDRVAARAAAAAAAEAEAAAAAAAAKDAQETLFFDTQPDLGVLSVGLPEHWTAMWDPHTKGVYYGNVITKVCVSACHGFSPRDQAITCVINTCQYITWTPSKLTCCLIASCS